MAVGGVESAHGVWVVGEVDLSVNSGERDVMGGVVQGWGWEGLMDGEVVALEVSGVDGWSMATLVG